MDFSFFEEVNEVVQEEPAEAIDPETLGLLASIGIAKGTAVRARRADEADPHRGRGGGSGHGPHAGLSLAPAGGAPLSEQRVGNAVRRRQLRIPARRRARILDARSFFFFYATGITPAMSMKMVGAGSQYAAAFVDAKGQPLDGGKTYRLHLPPGIPAKDFWSLVVYDNQTRSQLQTDQQFPSIGSQKKGVAINPDTRSTSTSVRRRRRARRTTGCRRGPARAGT